MWHLASPRYLHRDEWSDTAGLGPCGGSELLTTAGKTATRISRFSLSFRSRRAKRFALYSVMQDYFFCCCSVDTRLSNRLDLVANCPQASRLGGLGSLPSLAAALKSYYYFFPRCRLLAVAACGGLLFVRSVRARTLTGFEDPCIRSSMKSIHACHVRMHARTPSATLPRHVPFVFFTWAGEDVTPV